MATVASRGALTSLLQVLDRPGPLVILPHDNPDPDALASAATTTLWRLTAPTIIAER